MNSTCPISFKQVDEKSARINALLSAITVSLFLVTGNKFIILFLSFDFLIRGFIDPVYSYYTAVSKTVIRIFNIKPKLIEGSPKIFAAKLGFVFTALILLLTTMNLQLFALILSLLLITFTILEGVFGFCVGCKVYGLINMYKKTQHK